MVDDARVGRTCSVFVVVEGTSLVATLLDGQLVVHEQREKHRREATTNTFHLWGTI